MHILVVDDKQLALNSVSDLIERYGHTVVKATNGLDAFEKAQQDHFDMFVVDHLMPIMNGLQLAKNLHEHQTLSTKPVVLMTTQPLSEVSAMEEANFFDDILSKPINEELLISSINRLANENSRQQSL